METFPLKCDIVFLQTLIGTTKAKPLKSGDAKLQGLIWHPISCPKCQPAAKTASVRLMKNDLGGAEMMGKIVLDGSMSLDVEHLIANLHLPESDILNMFSFKFNNNLLTPDESIRFIHFLKNELDKRAQ
ncbi:hypothetical protein J2Z65_002788 [Paenibacillus aceris]|uniref:Uncharacterized protein n=2 Tax=Paenibacillus aceris TaxID=869555 RepID=A0ABS4HY29_9BACL|nr:hypothetical protein [Paenibacillus aceris]